MCCAFQVLTEVSKQDIAVLRTFQALAAGIFSRPAGMSDTHARHVHICNNCLSNMTGHHSFNPKDFSEDDLGSNGIKTNATSLGETPSFVRRLRGFAGLEINDKRVGQLEDDAASVRLRDTGSDASSEANFADVSSVESGCGGREGRATVTSNSVKKTRRTVARNGETFSDSEDEKDEAHKMDDFTENNDGPLKERDGTGVRFNVEEPIVGNSEGAVSKAKMTRAGTKDSLNSGHTRASSVTIPLADEGESIVNVVILRESSLFSFCFSGEGAQTRSIVTYLPDFCFYRSSSPVAFILIWVRSVDCVASSVISFSNRRPCFERFRSGKGRKFML